MTENAETNPENTTPETSATGFDSDAEFQAWRASRQQEHNTDPQTVEAPANVVPPETTSGGGGMTRAEVEAMLKERDEAHAKELRGLRTELATARASLPQTLIPEHSGGFGVDSLASTWSQYDQELARSGEHPFANGESADWLEHPDDVETEGNVRVRNSTRTQE